MVDILLRKYEVYGQEGKHQFSHEVHNVLRIILKLHDFTNFVARFTHLNDYVDLAKSHQIWNNLSDKLLTFKKTTF